MRDVAHHLQRRVGQLLESVRQAVGEPEARSRCRRRSAKPTMARQELTPMLRASSPDSSSFQPASATSRRRRQHARRNEAGDAGELPCQQ